MLKLHVREAQRAQGAAAEAQAAASKALDQQDTELAALREQLKEAQVWPPGTWHQRSLAQCQLVPHVS